MKLNADWHAKHKMPKNPSLDQRVKWHMEHARHCSCHPLSGKIQEEVKKRYLGTHQEFWVFFTRDDHYALAEWAATCAERALPLFEAACPTDPRPQHAIQVLREWIKNGQFSMPVIRGASLAAHAAARAAEKEDRAACYAARAAGQAVATAHVTNHALGAALYALKAIAAAHPDNAIMTIEAERSWQLQCLPENLRQWVLSGIKQKQSILPAKLRF